MREGKGRCRGRAGGFKEEEKPSDCGHAVVMLPPAIEHHYRVTEAKKGDEVSAPRHRV